MKYVRKLSNRTYNKTFEILQNKINFLDREFDEAISLSEKAKILIVINELSGFKDIFDERSSDGRGYNRKAEKVDENDLYQITLALTNHPTNPLGHKATVALLEIKEAVLSGDKRLLDKKVREFLGIPEITKKRTTDESYYLINYFAKLAWKTYDTLSPDAQKLISIEDWLNDADGNPNKTLAALKVSLVHSNQNFRDCLVGDLLNISRKTMGVEPALIDLISKIKDFKIDENNLLNASDLAGKIRSLGVSAEKKALLEKLSEKIECFGGFITKSQIRQEGNIYSSALKLAKDRMIQEGFGENEDCKFSFDDDGNIIAVGDNKTAILFQKSEFAQKIAGDNSASPLEKEQVPIDHFAKLVYLSNQNQDIAKTFIMSEFKGAEEMSEALKLFKLTGFDTKKINLFPLYEEIENYPDIKTFINILDPQKGSEQLTDAEKLIKQNIDETGTVRVMFAASDTTKRGGVEAYTKMFYHLTELCDAIAAYNETQPESKRVKLSFFWGGGPDPSRGGAINFIRAAKSIAGDREVPIEIATTLQGEFVERLCDPINQHSYLSGITEEYKYQTSEREKFAPEKDYVKKKNQGIWRKVSEIFGILGAKLKTGEVNQEYFNSAYKKFADQNLIHENPFLDLLSKLASSVNTSDRPDSRKVPNAKDPFYKSMRAIGYALMGRIAGFNNITLGYADNFRKYFGSLRRGNAKISAEGIQGLYNDSTTFQSQSDSMSYITGLTDIGYLEKVANIVEKNNPEKYAGTEDFVKKIKVQTYAAAKFEAISINLANEDTKAEDAYVMMRELRSKHLNKDIAEKSKELMLQLFEEIAKGNYNDDRGNFDVSKLGPEKAVVAAMVFSIKSLPRISPTLQEKKDRAKIVCVEMERGGRKL